ncbi:PASTA domain-containing protein [Corynebacterium sp. 3HC-13]|uniref:protein kinase domain-containing protein n=1 Tax=Corynebacterium poyangense TaxID=2684405 RepID=UPI001CCC65EE|nr:PASTA domain-containing protein [Corynebacterium poyangense]MBZ8178163.1 PASTA domain-containing protein [Corynebacterium poyangense]
MVELKVGDILEARYRIDRPIARGGMSTVYRCVDLRLARAVAVKVMDQRFATDPVFRTRFRREARAMAQLSHPNLVNVYDFGSDGDHIFLVMELITGGTLRELLAETGPLPPYAAAGVIRSLLTGLSVAHNAGMVHRDIKPDNVLINNNHLVKLADFGLVRAASRNTETGKIVGTVSYLSPEQVSGGEITTASDVYSAGILFYELLTGHTPFHGETQLDHAYHRLKEDVPSPSAAEPGIPHLVDELVATATAREPSQRFTDAEEYLAALDDVSRELKFPNYIVPIPQNAAAHRAAEIPPDTSGLTGPLEPTGIIDHPDNSRSEDLTEVIRQTRVAEPDPAWAPSFNDNPAAHETSILAQPNIPGGAIAPARQPVSPDAPPPGETHTHSASMSNRSGWTLALWLVVIAALTAAIALGGWWFGSGRYGEIPQVFGMGEQEATRVLEQAGFSTEVREVYDNNTTVSLAAGTDPAAGEKEVRGRSVTLLISLGKPVIPALPDNRDPETYRQALTQHSLIYQRAEQEFSDSIPEGKIVRVDPSPGQTVNVDTQISVHLSKGPAPVKVPDVKKMELDKAQEVLEKAGLKLGDIRHQFDANAESGLVFATDPLPGVELAKGSAVNVSVSTAIKVPDVVGLTRDKAEEKLRAEGIQVKSIEVAPNTVADRADTVVEISAEQGQYLDPENAWVILKTPEKVKVPRLLGSKISDARQKLEAAGLGIRNSDEDSSRIYHQSPKAGEEVSPSTVVTVDGL